MGYTRICCIDSMYSFLQYCLLSSNDQIESTFFFFGNSISKEVIDRFNGHCYVVRNYRWSSISEIFILFYLYYILFPLKFSFILSNKLEYWGASHLQWAPAVLRRHKYHLLEDGLLNYSPRSNGRFKLFKTFLFGSTWRTSVYTGEDNNCIALHLTAMVPDSPIMKNPNLSTYSMQLIYGNKSEAEINYINEIFNLSKQDITVLKEKKIIVLSQPFSEDISCFLTENEKIDLYKKILSLYNEHDVVFKPHPREITNYDIIFPNLYIFKKKIPMEYLSLLGIKFEIVVANYTSAIFNFPYPIKKDLYINEKLKGVATKALRDVNFEDNLITLTTIS